MPEKTAILLVAPNDEEIDEAVRVWREEHHYNVVTHVIGDLQNVSRDLETTISRYSSIPSQFRDYPRTASKISTQYFFVNFLICNSFIFYVGKMPTMFGFVPMVWSYEYFY